MQNPNQIGKWRRTIYTSAVLRWARAEHEKDPDREPEIAKEAGAKIAALLQPLASTSSTWEGLVEHFAEDVADFDSIDIWLEYLYDLADRDRIWLGGA
jgi:hypothetical protein